MSGRERIVKTVLKEITEEKVKDAIWEAHRIFKAWAEASWNLTEKWKEWATINGELKIDLFSKSFILSRWIKDRKIVWLSGSEKLSNLITVKATLIIAMMRHNPMSLKIYVRYGFFRQALIESEPLLEFEDCFHLESEEHTEEIAKTVAERFKKWKEEALKETRMDD